LGVTKLVNGSQAEIDTWKEILKPLCRNNNWRWKDLDPFEVNAFFGAISCILSGKNYSMRTPISMLRDQLAWFAYVVSFMFSSIVIFSLNFISLNFLVLKKIVAFVVGFGYGRR